MVRIMLAALLLPGCLTMGAKLEVQRILDAHQVEHAVEVAKISREAADTRVEEVFRDRLPALVEITARPIANDRSLEVLEAKIPGMVDRELRQAGLTREFVDTTASGVKATQEELAKTDWPSVLQTVGLALIAAWMGKKAHSERKAKRNGNGGQ